MSAALATQDVVAETYAVACDLTIPVKHDEPLELGAVARIDHTGVRLEIDGRDVTNLPTTRPVDLMSYEVHIPAPGPTQIAAADDDVRTALEHCGWKVV